MKRISLRKVVPLIRKNLDPEGHFDIPKKDGGARSVPGHLFNYTLLVPEEISEMLNLKNVIPMM